MVTSFRVKEEKTISDEWGRLQKFEYETENEQGGTHSHKAEVYDPGNGVAVLLYNIEKGTVLLIRQFRFVTTMNGNPSGLMVEACAGKVDDLSPEETIVKEIWEETGYRIKEVTKVLSIYPSPGSFVERLDLFVAPYRDEDRKGAGGGLKEEGEDIEVLEYPLKDALEMIQDGRITDGKTIILLQHAALNGLLVK